MKEFGGPALLLDRNDINTDEIIPAKYLTENTKMALQPFILEDLKLGGFDPKADIEGKGVIITRANFGCGSSREHAVWVFEMNDINVVIAESFARIFRQNMYNCGMLAIELPKEDIETLFNMGENLEIAVNLNECQISVNGNNKPKTFDFALNPFDLELVKAGGWLEYADKKY